MSVEAAGTSACRHRIGCGSAALWGGQSWPPRLLAGVYSRERINESYDSQ